MSAPWVSGGRLEFSLDVPAFVFLAPDLEATRALLRHMFVEADVRFDLQGRLAYHLGVPDRELPEAAIPLTAEQARRAGRGSAMMNVSPTYIAGAERAQERIDLSRFVMDVTHDWSGAYARAVQAFAGKDPAAAAALLQPLCQGEQPPFAARRLLGRCLREQGRLDEAIEQYLLAVRSAVITLKDDLLPLASGGLNDLGVAFKRRGDPARAATCLLHALHLRPNYPQALLTLAATLEEPALARYAAARTFATGGARPLAETLLQNFAGEDPAAAVRLRAEAEALAPRIDLGRWPLSRRGMGTLGGFLRDLEAGEVPFSRADLGGLEQLPEEAVPGRRPWWKLW